MNCGKDHLYNGVIEKNNHIKNTTEKLKKKNADIIIANDVKTIGAKTASVIIISADGSRVEIENKPKDIIAKRTVKVVEKIGK